MVTGSRQANKTALANISTDLPNSAVSFPKLEMLLMSRSTPTTNACGINRGIMSRESHNRGELDYCHMVEEVKWRVRLGRGYGEDVEATKKVRPLQLS